MHRAAQGQSRDAVVARVVQERRRARGRSPADDIEVDVRRLRQSRRKIHEALRLPVHIFRRRRSIIGIGHHDIARRKNLARRVDDPFGKRRHGIERLDRGARIIETVDRAIHERMVGRREQAVDLICVRDRIAEGIIVESRQVHEREGTVRSRDPSRCRPPRSCPKTQVPMRDDYENRPVSRRQS